MHARTSCPHLSVMGALWLGEVGDAEGTMPSGEHFPPGGTAECLSLSPAWSFIIYRGDKIKQTQQNGAKSESRGSRVYTLVDGGGCKSWRCTQRLTLSNFLFLPRSIPQRAAVRWKAWIRATTTRRRTCATAWMQH